MYLEGELTTARKINTVADAIKKIEGIKRVGVPNNPVKFPANLHVEICDATRLDELMKAVNQVSGVDKVEKIFHG